MNKQRYLVELQRLLVFMTEEDKELAVRRYADMFDAAGEEGEAELIARIGSPTKTAISLSRGYEPGKLEAVLPAEAAPVKKEKAALTETEDDPWGDLPAFDLPELDPEAPETKPEPAEASSQPEPAKAAPAREPAKRPPVTADAGEGALPEEDAGEEPDAWRKAKAPAVYERTMSLGVGIPLFLLVMVALGLPIAALFILAMAALLVPGGTGIVCAYLAAVGGLWCMSYIADAIMMFGLAFILLAVGLVVLWAGVWVDVKLARLYIAGVRWLSGELLGRKVSEYE